MTPADVVRRARAACGKGTRYGLGDGGMDPRSVLPSTDGRCDCSGFVAWCLGMSREQPASIGWIETTRVYEDARAPHRLFQAVTRPEPGDVVVYPDRNGDEGHIGLVTATFAGAPSFIAHCNARTHPDAIVNEPYSAWWRDAVPAHGAIFARCLTLERETDLKSSATLINGHRWDGYLDPSSGQHYLPLAAIKAFLVAHGATVEWKPGTTDLVTITLPPTEKP